jgi:hypothetical protein
MAKSSPPKHGSGVFVPLQDFTAGFFLERAALPKGLSSIPIPILPGCPSSFALITNLGVKTKRAGMGLL